jgi:hypothetical protein
VAVADVDNDGALDLYVANQGSHSLLYHNRLEPPADAHHWLGLLLVGRPELARAVGGRTLASTASAVGARVELDAGGRTQVREVSGGTGYASQSEMRLHFGLGAQQPAHMRVYWPSGREQGFDGAPLAACRDGYARLVEGGALEPGRGAGAASPRASRVEHR